MSSALGANYKMTNRFKPYWEEHGRPYVSQEFQFSETQIDDKTMKAVINYVRMAMNVLNMMQRYGISPNETRTLDPFSSD